MATWKRDAVSGLVVLVPVLVTLWVVGWVYAAIANVPLPRQAIWTELFGPGREIGEFAGVVLTVVLLGGAVVSTGYLMRSTFGRVVERRFDDLINRIPGLRIVYNASKTAADTALSGSIRQQTPVKLELWNGMRLTAFKTGKRSGDGDELVFVPTSPNVTSGLLVEVDARDVIETDERVEGALARVLSAGFGDTDDGEGEDGTGGETGSRGETRSRSEPGTRGDEPVSSTGESRSSAE